jgi:hypothetical protein
VSVAVVRVVVQRSQPLRPHDEHRYTYRTWLPVVMDSPFRSDKGSTRLKRSAVASDCRWQRQS